MVLKTTSNVKGHFLKSGFAPRTLPLYSDFPDIIMIIIIIIAMYMYVG